MSHTPTPHGGRREATQLGLSSPFPPSRGGNLLHTIQPIVSPSGSSNPTSRASATAAAAANILRLEAFQADQEDFWVVFTGTAPGVHQGR